MNTGRHAVAALTALYGMLVAVANARNDILTNDFTSRWVLVGSNTDFPGEFGRDVLPGTIALGVLFVVVAGAVAVTGGTPRARPLGAGLAVAALVLLAGYRDDGNLLGAKPSAAAVLLAVALYLLASSLRPEPVRPRHDSDSPPTV